MKKTRFNPNSFLSLASMLILFLPMSAAVPADVEYLSSVTVRALNLPFSEVVRVDNTLYLSGQLGNIPGKHELVPGGIKAETKQTLENISATLKRYNSSLEQIVKCTIFLADIRDMSEMNEVYSAFFPENYPARSAIAGSGLALGARVEIECIAILQE